MGPTHISHYRILGTLGAGGMGEVYLAEDTRLHRKVAIKLLPDAFHSEYADRVRRFEQEARPPPRSITRTCHDSRNRRSEAGRFIVMELVRGARCGARRRTRANPHLTDSNGPTDCEALARRARGGDHSPRHQAGKHHGARRRLCEGARFRPGAAGTRRTSRSPRKRPLAATDPGTLLGTVRYMAPEQARGETVSRRPTSSRWASSFTNWRRAASASEPTRARRCCSRSLPQRHSPVAIESGDSRGA